MILSYDTVMHIFMPHYLIRNPEMHQRDPYVLERHRSSVEEHAAILRALKLDGDEAAVQSAVQNAVRAHIRAGLCALIRRREDEKQAEKLLTEKGR